MVTLNLLSDMALIREPLTFEAGMYFVCIACILLTLKNINPRETPRPITPNLRVISLRIRIKGLCKVNQPHVDQWLT